MDNASNEKRSQVASGKVDSSNWEHEKRKSFLSGPESDFVIPGNFIVKPDRMAGMQSHIEKLIKFGRQ